MLFAEEVQGQLLEVIGGFLNSPDGQGMKLADVTDGALFGFGHAGFEVETSVPVPVDMGSDLLPCHYKLDTAISPEGRYSLNFTRHWEADGNNQSEGFKHSGRFDPFLHDVSEVTSDIMLSYMKEHSDNYISGMLTEHLTARIGKERPRMGWELPRQEI